MSEPLESAIHRAFDDEYREPPTDLRSALGFHARPRRGRLAAGVLVFALVGAVVAATVSLPRLAGRGPASGQASSGFIPDFGYRLAGSRSGGAGRTYLGIVPAGYEYGVYLSNTCSAKVTPFHLPHGDGPAGAGWLLAVEAGNTAAWSVPAGSGRHPCQGSGGGTRTTLPAPRRLELYVVAARGVRWKAELEVARVPGPLASPPAILGGCSSNQVGWGSSAGRTGKGGWDYQAYPTGQGAKPCRFVAEVRLGLYLASSLRPLAVGGNLQLHQISGVLNGSGRGPSATWIWTNWCGPRSAVQVVLQLSSGALLMDSNSPIPLPACKDSHAPSVLRLTSSG